MKFVNKQILLLVIILAVLAIVLTYAFTIDYSVNTIVENPYSPITCEPSDQDKIDRCLDSYHCLDNDPECIEEDRGIQVTDICSNPDKITIDTETGCLLLEELGTTICGDYSFSVNTDYTCKP